MSEEPPYLRTSERKSFRRCPHDHGRVRRGSGLCETCYRQIHVEVIKVRGKAKGYDCILCESKAKEWSMVHGTDGRDPYNHFRPLCASCHKRYDGQIVAESNHDRKGESRTLSTEAKARVSTAVAESNRRRTGERHSEESKSKMVEVAKSRKRDRYGRFTGGDPK